MMIVATITGTIKRNETLEESHHQSHKSCMHKLFVLFKITLRNHTTSLTLQNYFEKSHY